VPVLAAVLALAPVPGREHRGEHVVLLNRVVDRLRVLPPGPVLTEDHTWWTKSRLYLARDRLEVPVARDPAFLDAEERRARRRLDPLPDVAAHRGGYVVTGPVRPRAGWPRNWSAARARIRAEVPWDALVPVDRVGDAVIWRWPAEAPAVTAAGPGAGRPVTR